MNQLIVQPQSLPAPRRGEVNVREARMEDLAFIDDLQKRHTKQVGFLHRKALEGKVARGEVLIAETQEAASLCDAGRSDGAAEMELPAARSAAASGRAVGYLIGSDRYHKHDNVGIIYQINVIESERRGLVAATLLKAQFDRSAYGCRLYCCWCAQDLEANRFWEAMGFVPLAFRTGSATRGKGKKPRVHIFWQKRIRAGDESTPWWFPSETSGGSITTGRLVLPIPPGTHWSDEMPILLPGIEVRDQGATASGEAEAVSGGLVLSTASPSGEAVAPRRKPPRMVDPIAHLSAAERRKLPVNIVGGLRFMVPAPEPVKEKRPAPRNDPKLIAAARELRDRWLEEVARDRSLLLPNARYDVCRALPEIVPARILPAEVKLLAA